MEEDYPANLMEFEARFATESACRDYLTRLRWPGGFVCPRCQAKVAWPASRDRLICRGCRFQVRLTAGTIFQDTRKPLRFWFRAIWWVTSQKNGASAMGLQRQLGLGSYVTAWTWLHKLRRAMVRPGRDRLNGRVEVDETYVGGVEEGTHGRKTTSKALVVIAAQEDGKGMGRIRMQRIEEASAIHLHRFIEQSIDPGSTVVTDGWRAYPGIVAKGYKHEVTQQQDSEEDGDEVLPRVHRIAALVKRWLLGTHQGAVSREHLDYYLDEFTFRFNRRSSRYRGKLFFRLLQQAVDIAPVPYAALVKHARGRRPCATDSV